MLTYVTILFFLLCKFLKSLRYKNYWVMKIKVAPNIVKKKFHKFWSVYFNHPLIWRWKLFLLGNHWGKSILLIHGTKKVPLRLNNVKKLNIYFERECVLSFDEYKIHIWTEFKKNCDTIQNHNHDKNVSTVVENLHIYKQWGSINCLYTKLVNCIIICLNIILSFQICV